MKNKKINTLFINQLTKYYVLFLTKIVKSKDETNGKKVVLDKLLLNTPVAALEAARTELIRGINILQEMLRDTMHMVYRRDEKKMAAIIDNEIQ